MRIRIFPNGIKTKNEVTLGEKKEGKEKEIVLKRGNSPQKRIIIELKTQ